MRRPPRCLLTVLAALLAVLIASPGSDAAESVPVTSSRTIATLITDASAVSAGQALHAGLRLRLAPGWHTYWQNPGDAGIPPSVDLAVSAGVTAGPLQWPLPKRVAEGSLTTYAYVGDVVLPFTIMPGAGSLDIKAHAEWLACRDICVPEQADLTLVLPPGPNTQAPEAPLIAAALSHVPTPAPFHTSLTRDGTLTLFGAGVPAKILSAQFFPTASGVVEQAAAQRPVLHNGALTLKIDPALGPAPTDGAGIVALTDANGLVTAYAIAPTTSLATPPVALLGPLLALALGGGLLLNLMPCVFPILALKAMALTRLSGAKLLDVRLEAATYTLGVVTAFVALGGALVALRAAGEGVGWGFQFQSPVFVTAIAWLLFAVGLSLSGVFVVGVGLMGRGQALTGKTGYWGSFLTGVLAVIVATPCTAPFMGSAIAGALTLPSVDALCVFGAVGLGLALPYALIAVVPRIATLLPRPGAWMATLQQLLAFPMYAASVWLVWVVSQQSGPAGVLTAGTGLLGVGLAGWALGFANHHAGWSARVARGAALAALIGLAGLLYLGTGAPTEQAEPFSTARLDELRGEGRPVFVNMTAAWCLSCLVNEKIALSPPAVRQAFARSNIAYLKGDWTRQDPAISSFLHTLGQDGVPLYVFYAPGRPPIVLPQILSESTILDEVSKLGS